MSANCGRFHPTVYCQCEVCGFANEDRLSRLRALQAHIPLFDVLDQILSKGWDIRLHKSGRQIFAKATQGDGEIVASSTHPDSLLRNLATEIGEAP